MNRAPTGASVGKEFLVMLYLSGPGAAHPTNKDRFPPTVKAHIAVNVEKETAG